MVSTAELVKKLTWFRISKIISGLCYILILLYFVYIYYILCSVSCDLKTQAASIASNAPVFIAMEIQTPIACLIYGIFGAHVLYLGLRTTPSLPSPPAHFKRFKADNVGTIILIIAFVIGCGIVLPMLADLTPPGLSEAPLVQPYNLSIGLLGLVPLLAGLPAEIMAKGYRKAAAKQEAAEKVEDRQAIEQMKRRAQEEAKAGAFAATLEQEFDKWGQGTEKATNAGGKVDAAVPSQQPAQSGQPVSSLLAGARIEKARKLVRMSTEVTIPDLARVLQVSRDQLLDKLIEGDGAPGVTVKGDLIAIENKDAFVEFIARAFAHV